MNRCWSQHIALLVGLNQLWYSMTNMIIWHTTCTHYGAVQYMWEFSKGIFHGWESLQKLLYKIVSFKACINKILRARSLEFTNPERHWVAKYLEVQYSHWTHVQWEKMFEEMVHTNWLDLWCWLHHYSYVQYIHTNTWLSEWIHGTDMVVFPRPHPLHQWHAYIYLSLLSRQHSWYAQEKR